MIALLCSFQLMAQSVSFKAKGPNVVSVNEQFEFSYEVNAQGNNLKPGNMSDFNILQGPYSSSSSSISVINGQVQQSMSISYTYVLSAKKAGKFTIGAASITIQGKEYSSNALTIEVVAGNGGSQGNNQSNSNTIQNIDDKDVFVRLETNKKSVYKGEAIVANIKLYTKVQLQQLSDFKIPQFDGFWKEDLDTPNQRVEWRRENVNGEIYHAAVISQCLLMPQKSGEITIKAISMEVIALQEVKQKRRKNPFNDPFLDDFFNESSYQRVNKALKSAPVKIQVKEIPDAAQALGDFTLSSQISKTELKANESITLKITVAGKGNLKMVEPFKMEFPADFEVFDPETKQNLKVTSVGISGSKTFEYVVIARHEGTFEIPGVSLDCFDPTTGKLKHLSTKAYTIKVAKGDGSTTVTGVDHSQNKEDIKFIGKDIRYIKTNNFALHKGDPTWFGSLSFYLGYVFTSGAFVFLFVFLRKRRLENEDLVGMRKKKAGAMARKRLKTAEQFLQENNSSKFYTELLQGIWGYLGDKLNLQKSDLSKEKIRQALADRRVSTEGIAQLIRIMEKCEMAQYAPLGNNNSLSEDYQASVEVITQLEGEIKAS